MEFRGQKYKQQQGIYYHKGPGTDELWSGGKGNPEYSRGADQQCFMSWPMY